MIEFSKSGKFMTADVWNFLRLNKEKVGWCRLLCHSAVIPKHVVVVLMAILWRLPTLDRMRSWGITLNTNCLLCGAHEESHSHLFFECPFSKDLWTHVFQNCGISRQVLGWNEELNWAISRIKEKALLSVV